MKSFLTRTVLGTAVAATALASAAPAMADPYYGHHRGNGDATGAAIAGGIIGLALGAIIVSSSQHHRDRYDGDRYYQRNYQGNYRNRDGYRYDNDGRPYGYDHGSYNGYYYNNGWGNR
jgi:hypothetical protein